MQVLQTFALSFFLLATVSCQTKYDSKGPKLRKADQMLVVEKNHSWELEDAIDLADAKCSEYGGSWNGEDCVRCYDFEIWDRNEQACYRALR